MTIEDKWSWKRFWMLIVITLATAALSCFAVGVRSKEPGDWLLIGLSGVVFSVIFALHLEWERKEQGIFHEKSNNFVRIASAYFICCVLTGLISFLPGFSRPSMIAAVLMTMVSTPFTGLLSGCFFSIILVFSGGESIALLSCYILLCVCGCIVAQYLQDKRNLYWSNWMMLTAAFCLSGIFSMADEPKLSFKTLTYGIFSGILSCMTVTLLFRLWNDKIVAGRDEVLRQIIDEKYELVGTMRAFSKADYEHAKKVSRIVKECAKAVEADEMLAEAAGFYYRVGRLEGKPYVENGIAVAQKHNFPPELVRILGEYNGEKYRPSTLESALVHIVDNVVGKFDVLDRTTLSSSWNQDIIVYQTLNENSARGLYDKAGLSMNMFLVVRDYLIKEAGLYDDNH